MVKLTCSLKHWLFHNHPYEACLITSGHVELFTPEMQAAYIEWCKTEEGKRYLVGGDLYHAEN